MTHFMLIKSGQGGACAWHVLKRRATLKSTTEPLLPRGTQNYIVILKIMILSHIF